MSRGSDPSASGALRRAASLPGPIAPGEGAIGAALAAAVGALLGAVAVRSPLVALAAALGLGFIAIVFYDIAAGLALFVVLTFFERVPGVATAQLTLVKLAGAALAAAWLMVVIARRETKAPLLSRERPMAAYLIVLLLAWSLISMLWATDPMETRSSSFRLAQGLLLVFIVFTAVRDRRHVRWLAWAYIGGALLTALVGLAGASRSEQVGPYADINRLVGGIGDANELAAILVPALFLAAFALAGSRSPFARWVFASCAGVFAVALLLTQSRGGLVALAVTLPAAVLFSGPLRARAFAFMLAITGAAASYYTLVAPPQVLARLADFSAGGGTGRVDLWKVALDMFGNHPANGIGLGNFVAVEPSYAVRNINLPRADLVVDTPKVTHNTYLQILAELGVVGAVLFAAVLLVALVLAFQAVRTFARIGDWEMQMYARGIVVGAIGMLAAFVFLSGQYEKQLWLLLGFAIALSSVAARSAAESRAGEAEPPPG